MTGLETLALAAVPAGLVGAKASMLLNGVSPGNAYNQWVNSIATAHYNDAVNLPSLTLPNAPQLNIPTQGTTTGPRAPRAPRSSGQLAGYTTNYASQAKSPAYTTDAFNSTIMQALDGLYSSNSLINDDPNYGKIIGADLAPTELANYAKDVQGNISSTVAKMQDISSWDVNKLNELGSTADYEDIRNMVYFGTTESFTPDRLEAIQKNLLGINNTDMAERSTAKRFGVTVDEYRQFKSGVQPWVGTTQSDEIKAIAKKLSLGGAKYLDQVETTGKISKSALVNILSYENALQDGSQKFNQFTAGLKEAQRSGQKYFSFNISGNKATYGKVGSGGLERQAAEVVDNINSVVSNEQLLIQQQQQQAELERQNAQNAIYNQLTRSRQRRGY